MPISRGSRCVPPPPGIRPSVTSGKPKRADGTSAAIRRWQASASSKPPPSAVPFSAATNGLPPVSSLRIAFRNGVTIAIASAGAATRAQLIEIAAREEVALVGRQHDALDRRVRKQAIDQVCEFDIVLRDRACSPARRR